MGRNHGVDRISIDCHTKLLQLLTIPIYKLRRVTALRRESLHSNSQVLEGGTLVLAPDVTLPKFNTKYLGV